jgi:hypothetical protein
VKDFDVLLATDREFTLGGETFHWRYQSPEALEVFSDSTSLEGFPLLDAQILLFIEPEEHDRYRALRARAEDPIPGGLVMAVIQWLVEQQTNFPTVLPSPSEVGRGKTERTSKAA